LGLSTDVLAEQLKHQNLPEIETALTPLRHTSLEQIELRTREVLQTIRERHLPALQYNIEQNLAQTLDEVRKTLDTTIQATLEDVPLGGISTVRALLKALAETVSEEQQKVKEQRQQQRVDLKRSLVTVSNAHYALRSVILSIPPWPVTLLSVVATLILPLLYAIQLAKIIRPLSETGMLFALAIFASGVLATLAFVGLRLFRQKNIICTQHIEMIHERFGIESASPINRAMNSIYESTQKAIEQAQTNIDALVTDMQVVSAQLEAKQAKHTEALLRRAAPGPIRSIVNLDRAEAFYQQIVSEQAVSRRQRLVPALDQLASDFVTEMGLVQEWHQECRQSEQPLPIWFAERLISFGRDYVAQHTDKMTVANLLFESPESDQAIRDMLGSAQPLWNYDPQVLRQAKTQRISLVGGLKRFFPQISFLDTRDPYSLIVLNVHRGLPLFALRRLGEYRNHYAAMLQHSKLPIHVTHELALANDLLTTRPREQLAPAALFAVGLAFNLLWRDPDGRYIAPRNQGTSIRLSVNKTRAAALLGMDRMACKELQRRLDALVSSKDPAAIHSVLDEYTAVVPDLEDWEVKGIFGFCRAYDLEIENEQVVLS
jgi:hypothetical protein